MIRDHRAEKVEKDVEIRSTVQCSMHENILTFKAFYHNSKKYSDAIASFNKAIKLDENYAKAYLNRGISKQMLRDEDGACSDWNKAKEFGITIAKKYLESDCE